MLQHTEFWYTAREEVVGLETKSAPSSAIYLLCDWAKGEGTATVTY